MEIVLIIGTLGGFLGQDGEALMSGISVLTKDAPESSRAFPPCEDSVEQKEGSHQNASLLVPWS